MHLYKIRFYRDIVHGCADVCGWEVNEHHTVMHYKMVHLALAIS